MNYLIFGIVALIIAIVAYRLFRKAKGLLISFILFASIFGGGSFLSVTDIINPINEIKAFMNVIMEQSTNKNVNTLTNDTTDDTIVNHYVPPLTSDTISNVTDGAVKYGATIVLGDLDSLGRSTYAHIQLKNEHEPGYIEPGSTSPREKRSEKINVDPVGWGNYKINGQWANNRCHLIGYQFSGLNDELRNLSIGTSYLNKGTEASGMDQSNPDGMLFYEQLLDGWLSDNPSNTLDLYVKPLYNDTNKTPYAYYMQWIGFDGNENEISIQIGGHSVMIQDNTNGVILLNQSPNYNIDYTTGIVTAN